MNKLITLFSIYFQSKVNDLKFGFWKETSNEKSAFNETSSIKSDWVQVFRLWNKSSSAFVSTTQWMNFGDPSSDDWHVICVRWVWTDLINKIILKFFNLFYFGKTGRKPIFSSKKSGQATSLTTQKSNDLQGSPKGFRNFYKKLVEF